MPAWADSNNTSSAAILFGPSAATKGRNRRTGFGDFKGCLQKLGGNQLADDHFGASMIFDSQLPQRTPDKSGSKRSNQGLEPCGSQQTRTFPILKTEGNVRLGLAGHG